MTTHRYTHQFGLRFEQWIDVVGFAGFGGTCLGFQMATGKSPDVAINHWPEAIAVHALNHPQTYHYCENVFHVDPVKACNGRKVRGFWISPDCTHHSNAKGSKPLSTKRRALAKIALRWAKDVKPLVIFLENVQEFLKWGPLNRAGRPIASRVGEYFAKYIRDLRRLGYDVEWRKLTACDFGSPTSRKRLFLVARSDGQPIVWPTPTHGPGRLPYRTAADCIDWSLPTRSVFGRKKPLAAATMRRIAAGMRRFVLGEQKPYLIQTGYGERVGQAPRIMSLDVPIGTMVAGGCKHGLVSVFVTKEFGGPNGNQPPGLSLRSPLGTITTVDHHSLVSVRLEQDRDASADVIAFFAEHGLGEPVLTINGERYVIVDICKRPLSPREKARAQGFPDSYVLRGTIAEMDAMVGNSVAPHVAAALIGANLASEPMQVAA